ncbi:hypothetical protein SAMN04489800_4224 [Pseudomonas deceptionensis]|uniref:Uncharacterized protein n=1 Tax=Pseudomonas deceptionensis TaxID=882211 RepID=A0A1H5P0V8_PSEDM|nr:hypothetical protein SAMN04489800_4224 [Pseudomonas deceptionensis]
MGTLQHLISRMLSVLCDLCDNERRLGRRQRVSDIAS